MQEALSEIEQALLIAAAMLGQGPRSMLDHANSHKVVRMAARSLGLAENDIRCVEAPDWHPLVKNVFDTLVRMVHHIPIEGPDRPPRRPGEALFEVGGNWGVPGNRRKPPSWCLFTSCRLTQRGWDLAQELLAQRNQES